MEKKNFSAADCEKNIIEERQRVDIKGKRNVVLKSRFGFSCSFMEKHNANLSAPLVLED